MLLLVAISMRRGERGPNAVRLDDFWGGLRSVTGSCRRKRRPPSSRAGRVRSANHQGEDTKISMLSTGCSTLEWVDVSSRSFGAVAACQGTQDRTRGVVMLVSALHKY